MRRVIAAVAVFAVAVSMIGCGGGADYSSPKATFNTMWAAAKAGNEKAMMACFDKKTRDVMAEMKKIIAEMAELAPKKMGEKGDIVKEMMKEAKKAGEPEFGEQKIDGDKATLKVTMVTTEDGKTKRREETVDFIKEGGAWKITIPKLPDPAEMKKALDQMRKMIEMMKGMKKK